MAFRRSIDLSASVSLSSNQKEKKKAKEKKNAKKKKNPYFSVPQKTQFKLIPSERSGD